MISIVMKGHIEVQRNLLLMPPEIKKRVKDELMRIGFDLSNNVKKNFLSGQYLKVVTNALRGSTNVKYVQTPVEMTVYVGTTPFYGKLHHEGFSGIVQRKSKTGKTTKPYQLILKPKPYLSDALSERKDAYLKRIQDAVGLY